MMNHSLVRTSPMGQPFIGTCILCGVQGLSLSSAFKMKCESESAGKDHVVLAAIKGESPNH